MNVLSSRLARAFVLTRNLFESLSAEALNLDLPGIPSNRIAGQVWCIVGARESYARAIEAGSWSGFSCSLEDPSDRAKVLQALDATASKVGALDLADASPVQLELAFDLLEHEVQHHGQLIRYMYAHSLPFPETWQRRYGL